MTGDFDGQVADVAALADPVRRSLYRVVAQSPEPVSRDQAAAAVGVSRTLAAFHLERLAEQGLVEFEFRRLTGRTGPGAGRPAKLYRRADRQIEVSLPPRQYDLAARLLAEAIQTADAARRPVRAELEQVCFARGQRMGEAALQRAGRRASQAKRRQALLDVLASHGFEPRQAGADVILANCPFHALAQHYTDLVCEMNLHLMRGAHRALGLDERELQPRLEPEPGHCCVKFSSSAA